MAPTELQPCLGVPGVGEPGLVQGIVEHAEEDRDLVSSNCSQHRALQKVLEHGQQLGRGRNGKQSHSCTVPVGFPSPVLCLPQ